MVAVVTAMQPLPASKGAQTRQAILDAAIARFGREGYRATSVADIARDAGVAATAPYAYFDGKEALFFAAADEDAAAVIREGVSSVLDTATAHAGWHESLIFTLVGAVEHHPLARRLLAGLEPDVTARVLDIPALADLRKAVADRMRAEQDTGTLRADVDATSMANGVVAIMLSLLMSAVQLGTETAATYVQDIAAVFRSALEPPALPSPRTRARSPRAAGRSRRP